MNKQAKTCKMVYFIKSTWRYLLKIDRKRRYGNSSHINGVSIMKLLWDNVVIKSWNYFFRRDINRNPYHGYRITNVIIITYSTFSAMSFWDFIKTYWLAIRPLARIRQNLNYIWVVVRQISLKSNCFNLIYFNISIRKLNSLTSFRISPQYLGKYL